MTVPHQCWRPSFHCYPERSEEPVLSLSKESLTLLRAWSRRKSEMFRFAQHDRMGGLGNDRRDCSDGRFAE